MRLTSIGENWLQLLNEKLEWFWKEKVLRIHLKRITRNSITTFSKHNRENILFMLSDGLDVVNKTIPV